MAHYLEKENGLMAFSFFQVVMLKKLDRAIGDGGRKGSGGIVDAGGSV